MENRIGICPICGGYLIAENNYSDEYCCDTCNYPDEEDGGQMIE